MGLNFRKSVSIFPGVKLNLSKGGVGVSFGKKGLRQSINSSGRATTTIGIPGTGVYYTKSTNVKKIAGKAKDLVSGKNKDSKKKDAENDKIQDEEPKKSVNSRSNAVDETILEENRQKVAEYEAYIDAVKSVHKVSDGMIDWNTLNKGDVPTNIVKGSEEYKEWTELQSFSERVVAGDIDSYFEIIDEFKPFDDLLEFGSNFQVGTDRADLLEVEFAVKSDEVIPDTSLSLTASGAVSEKELSKTAYYDLVQDYVCSTTIRIARDAFALLPVNTVIVHAVDNILNTATGYEEKQTLLSVKFDREKIMSLNMSMIDPSDALSQFEHNMKFKKTMGFDPVSRIEA